MKKRNRILLTALVVVMIGGVVWLVWPEPPEPVYQGKKLSVWLWDDGYPWWSHGNSDAGLVIADQQRATDEVIRQLGTNAIPTLFRMLNATDPPFRKLAYKIEEHTGHHFNFSSAPAFVQNYDAAMALGALGSENKDVIPRLIKIYDRNGSFESQQLAALALGRIGPSASNAVPSLVRVVANSGGSRTPWASLRALGQIRAEPEKVVPVLVKLLNDPNVNIRRMAITALQAYGVDAKQAVPALVVSLSDPDDIAKTNAIRALKVIDPEAAAKAVVK